jgi:glycosyltransferase involved in cell wall biosynthesis
MTIKILLISSNSSARGGGEQYLVYLTQGLLQQDCEVHVLLSTKSYMDNWAKELSEVGAIVRREPLVGLRDRPLRFLQALLDFRQQWLISEVCQEIRPNAILVNQQYDEDGLDYLQGALNSGINMVIGTLHMPMTEAKNMRPFGKFRGIILQNWYKNHPYNLLFVSSGSKAEFFDYYQSIETIDSKVIHYGCPQSNQNFEQEDNVNALDGRTKIITVGFAGQFVYQKNLRLLVDSWLILRQNYSLKVNLLLIGDGPERSELESVLKYQAEDGWSITGWQTNPEAFFQKIDLYAMTSRFEGLPLALLEAAGSGLPCAVTNFNGAQDVAERANWVKVSTDYNPQSFAELLKSSIDQINQLKREALMGQEAFRNYFSVQRMARDTLDFAGVINQ